MFVTRSQSIQGTKEYHKPRNPGNYQKFRLVAAYNEKCSSEITAN
jgi:hypothetical protein